MEIDLNFDPAQKDPRHLARTMAGLFSQMDHEYRDAVLRALGDMHKRMTASEEATERK